MTAGFRLENLVRRSNRNLLMACLIGLAVVVIGGVISLTYYRNFFSGPFPITVDQLAALPSLDGVTQYYVTLNPPAGAVADSGYIDYTVTNYVRTTNAYYFIVRMNDRIFLIRTPDQSAAAPFTGSLVSVPPDVVARLTSDHPEVRGKLYPFMLTAGDFRTPGYAGLAREHASLGNFHFTPNWIVELKPRSLKTISVPEIVWFYKQVSRAPTAKGTISRTAVLHVHDRRGQVMHIAGSEERLDKIHYLLSKLVPAAFSSYDPGLENLWQTNRAGFAAVVAGRRSDSHI